MTISKPQTESVNSAPEYSPRDDLGVSTAPTYAETHTMLQSSDEPAPKRELNVENINRMIQHIREDLKDEKINWLDWSSCFAGMAWRLDGSGSPDLRWCPVLEGFFGVSSEDAYDLAYMESANWDLFDKMPYEQQHTYLIAVLEHLRDKGFVLWPEISALTEEFGSQPHYSW